MPELDPAKMHQAVHGVDSACCMILRGLTMLIEHMDFAGIKVDLADVDTINRITSGIHAQARDVHKRFESEPH